MSSKLAKTKLRKREKKNPNLVGLIIAGKHLMHKSRKLKDWIAQRIKSHKLRKMEDLTAQNECQRTKLLKWGNLKD